MADIAVVPTVLVSGTASASTTDASCTSIAAAATNVWVVGLTVGAPALPSGEHLLLKFVGMAASTISILAGVRPPSQRADLGARTFTIANAEVKYIIVETARHLQANGSIRISVNTGDTTKCGAFILPKVH